MTQMRIVSLIFLVLLALCAVVARPNNDEANEIISIYNERNCLHQGGICVKEDFCSPSLRTAIKGLCPEQSHMGVECCYWDELP